MSLHHTKLGELDRRIVLLNYSVGKDNTGAPLETFSELQTVFAKIIYKSSTEKELINKETGVTKLDFIIRYRSDINTQNKIQYRNRTYDITGIEEIGINDRFLLINTRNIEIEAASITDNPMITDDEGTKIITDQGGGIIFE